MKTLFSLIALIAIFLSYLFLSQTSARAVTGVPDGCYTNSTCGTTGPGGCRNTPPVCTSGEFSCSGGAFCCDNCDFSCGCTTCTPSCPANYTTTNTGCGTTIASCTTSPTGGGTCSGCGENTRTCYLVTRAITYSAGAGGTLSGTASQTICHGSNTTAITAVPNSGYQFVNWSDNSTSNPRTDTSVTAAISVTANFELIPTGTPTVTPTPTETPTTTPTGTPTGITTIGEDKQFCDFSGDGIPGKTTGDVLIDYQCAVYEDVNGVSEGDLIIDSGVVTLHKKIAFSTTGQIDVLNSGILYVNTGGEVIQGDICVKDADSDNYADTVIVEYDPFGNELATSITQIEQLIITTPGCPDGYTSRADIISLAVVDTDFTSIDVAKTATSDRELLTLGFTIGGVDYAQAAVGDIQIIDKNLLICTGTECPATGFDGLTPATGNIYTAGKIGIGATTPASSLHLDKDGGNYIRFSEATALRGLVGVSAGGGTLLTGDADNDFIVRGESNIKFGIGSTQRMILESTGLSVTGTLTVSGNANICELKTYTAGSGTVACTAGYYTWAGVASATGGQMLCCKVSNPI